MRFQGLLAPTPFSALPAQDVNDVGSTANQRLNADSNKRRCAPLILAG